MGPDDHIVVTKDDNGNINLKDTESDKEYMIVGESEEGMGDAEIGMMEYDDYNLDQEEMAEDDSEMEMDLDDEDDEDSDIKSIVGNIFDESYVEEDMSMDSMSEEWEEQDEMVYEIEMDEDDNTMGVEEVDDMDEVVYEIEMDKDDKEEQDEEYGQYGEDDNYLEEAMKKIKAKGMGMGNPSKFKFKGKEVNQSGFKTKMKQGPKSVGTGKAKFEYDKSGENLDGEFRIKPKGIKKMETKESSRTLGSGSDFRKGGLPKRRAHSKANINIKENFDVQELRSERAHV